MSIQALPESTTRRLRVGQALPSPAALVKELLDNAIDARATSIEVFLSANTLDKIEVRDNGSGIAADDLEQVGKRGHTSKLTCFEELMIVGRTSLGFRGEALASACTMGKVVITTRTEGNPVATSVKLKATGGVDSRSFKSHPIGTTVCVSNLFSKFPVRKQNFLNQTSKNISEIKDLFQSYALARLHIRLSLKVTENPKSNWAYVARAQGGLKEAAAMVVGKDIAALCKEETQNFQGLSITIQVLLPRPDANLSKIKGGCHVSVDGRPLSSSRLSLARKIYMRYKEALKELARETRQEVCKNPFFYLRMSCAADIYDPNVEPGKDDIIFANADILMSSFDKFFRSAYSGSAIARRGHFPQQGTSFERPDSVLEPGFDDLLLQQLSSEVQERDKAAPSDSKNDQDAHNQGPFQGQPPLARPPTPFVPPPVVAQIANNLDSVISPSSFSNRTMADPQTQQPSSQLTSDTTPRQQRQHNRLPPNALQTPPASSVKSIIQILPHALCNPSPFSAFPSKPQLGQKAIEPWLAHSDNGSHPEDPPCPPTATTILDGDAPFGRSHSRPRRQTSYRSKAEITDVERPTRKQQKQRPALNAFPKAGELSVGMNASQPSSSQTEGLTAVNAFSRPSPGITHTDPRSYGLSMMSMDDKPHILGRLIQPSLCKLPCSTYRGMSRGSFTNTPFQSHRRRSVSNSNSGQRCHSLAPDLPMMVLDDDEPARMLLLPSDPSGHGTLEQALDFEHRKMVATKRLRAENALQELNPNKAMRGTNLERKTRMLDQMVGVAREEGLRTGNLDIDISGSDTASMEATSRAARVLGVDRPGTVLPHNDPRAYLMKRQKNMSKAGQKIKKCKTALLPLETVQPAEELHHLVLTLSIEGMNALARQRDKIEKWDEYVLSGMYKDELEKTEDWVENVEERFKAVMEAFEARNQSRGSQVLL